MMSKHTISTLGNSKPYITITMVDYATYIDGFDEQPHKDNIEDLYSRLCPNANKITTTIYKKL